MIATSWTVIIKRKAKINSSGAIPQLGITFDYTEKVVDTAETLLSWPSSVI